MSPKMKKSMDHSETGKKLIEASIRIDESLAELLKIEVRNMKKLLKEDAPIEKLETINLLLRSILFIMILTDERIENGIELCKNTEKKETTK